MVLCLAGLGLVFISPSHHSYRGLELLAAGLLLVTALGELLLGILFTIAARNVKPRKLGSD